MAICMALNYAYHLQSWKKQKFNIGRSAKCVYAKPLLYTHWKFKNRYKKSSVAGIGIFQEKWANFMVADAWLLIASPAHQ